MKIKHKLRDQLICIVVISLLMEAGMLVLFYNQYRSVVKNETEKSYHNLGIQIIEQFCSIKENIRNVAYQASYSKNMQDYLLEEEKLRKFENLSYIEENLDYMISLNKDIYNIKISDSSGGTVASRNEDMFPIGFQADRDYVMNEKEFKEGESFSKYYYNSKRHNFYFAYLSPIYSVYEKKYSSEPIGTCRILCSIGSIQRSMENLSLEEGADFMILDSENRILVAADKEKVGSYLSEDAVALRGNGTDGAAYSNDGCLIQFIPFPEENLELFYKIPVSMLTSEVPPELQKLFFFFLISAGLILIAAVAMIRSITCPITDLLVEMKEVSTRDGRKRLDINPVNEIGYISIEINRMLERIENLNKEKLRATEGLAAAKISQKQTELSFLRSQINPHFLYNSLECIKGIALSYGAKEIVSMTTSLSRLFRYSLSPNTMVPLKEELRIVMEYCNVMSIRFGRNYQLLTDIPEEYRNSMMMSMLLQPIVENSFKHGFKAGRGSIVRISARGEKNTLVITVEDDGIGMDKEALVQIQNALEKPDMERNDRVGLWNIHNRIRMQYGPDCGLTLLNGEKGGITVILQLSVIED